MPAFQRTVLLCLFCGLGLLPITRGFAQQAAGSRVVSYKTIAASELDFMLEQCILDANGHIRRPLLFLPKQFALEAAATSGTHNLYLLRKTYTDTVQLLLTDSVGRTLRQPRQFMQRMSPQTASLAGLPGGQGFIMTYPTGKGGHPEINIVRLGPDLAVQWKQQMTNKDLTSVKQITVNDSHVWVNLMQQVGPVTHQPLVWVASLATGQPTGTIALTPTEEVESVVLVPAGLLLLGNAHRDYLPEPAAGRPEPAGRRHDIARIITADGKHMFQTLSWPASGPPHHHWKTAHALPDGSYELVGETYREVANGGTLALAILGGGLMGSGLNNGLIPTSGYTNQQPVGLVVARLGPTGELTHLRGLVIPEAMHMNPADSTSALPKGKPVSFRVRGLSADQQYVVLNTTRQVLLYSLASGRLQPLTPARRTTPTVLGTEPGFINVGWTLVPGETLPEVEHAQLP